MKKTHILFITPAFYPAIGGVETHTREVGRRLVARGHTMTVLTETHRKEDHGKVRTIDGMEVFPLWFGEISWWKKFHIWREILRHRDLVQNADIVHCHDVFIWYLPLRFLFPRKPVFTTFHGYETVVPPTRKARFIRKMSEVLSWGNIIVGKYIQTWYGTKPDAIVYGGVNENHHKREIPSKIKSSSQPLRILLIGRLEQDIGVHEYLSALTHLKDRGVLFTLTVCGDGSLRKKAEKYGNVKGFVQNTTEEVQQADFVFASSYLSILTALSWYKSVFAIYTNALKKDYLEDSPLIPFIWTGNSGEYLAKAVIKHRKSKPSEQYVRDLTRFLCDTTWNNVVGVYERVWGKAEI